MNICNCKYIKKNQYSTIKFQTRIICNVGYFNLSKEIEYNILPKIVYNVNAHF